MKIRTRGNLIRLCVVVGLGFLTNVLVTWLLVIVIPVPVTILVQPDSVRGYHLVDHPAFLLEVDGGRSFTTQFVWVGTRRLYDEAHRALVLKNLKTEIDIPYGIRITIDADETPEWIWQEFIRRGWPFVSLYYRETAIDPGIALGINRYIELAPPVVKESYGRVSLDLPFFGECNLPLLPIWSGCVFGGLFYSLLWIGILRGRVVLRSYVRRRKGRCIQCGYDLRETPSGCPECGWQRALVGASEDDR